LPSWRASSANSDSARSRLSQRNSPIAKPGKVTTRLVALGRLRAQPGLRLFEAFDDAHRAVNEIEVAPSQRQDFAAPRASGDGNQQRSIDASAPQRGEQSGRLLGGQRRHLSALDLPQPMLERISGVARYELLFDWPCQSSAKYPMNVAPGAPR